MELTILVENTTLIDHYYKGEPGFCCLLEDGEEKLLLDTGYSGLYLENAAAMGIDLSQVGTIALSHGHDDHTGGLAAFFRAFPRWQGRVVCHPDALEPKRSGRHPVGSPLSRQEVEDRCRLVLSREPMVLSPHVVFLGEIPRRTAFEATRPLAKRWNGEGWIGDFLPDDTALAVEGETGQWVVTGCSHSGVCNILLRAQEVTGRETAGLLGGFHLLAPGPQTEETVRFLKGQALRRLIPCHCTGFEARVAMVEAGLPVEQIGVGSRLTL